jgi:hypothetical protein
MAKAQPLFLTDIILATFCALDDALQNAGIPLVNGKLIPRRGPKPDVSDLEILCCAILQELMDFDSDNAFYLWFDNNPVMTDYFPRRLSRPNFADRRALLAPLMEKLCGAICAANGEGDPPFLSSIHIPSKSAGSFEADEKRGSGAWQKKATAALCGAAFTACANT